MGVVDGFEEEANVADGGEEFGFAVAARDFDVGFEESAAVVFFAPPPVGEVQYEGLPGFEGEGLAGFGFVGEFLDFDGFDGSGGVGGAEKYGKSFWRDFRRSSRWRWTAFLMYLPTG